MHNDALLPLDEISEVDPRRVGEIVYMLLNGTGKGRANRDVTGRRTPVWRLAVLSSGEVSLAEKLLEAGRRPHAGQEVRLIEIPADAGSGFGLFENLHGEASAGDFANRLKTAALECFGDAARVFIDRLIPRLSDVADIAAHRDDFIKKHLPTDATGQVHRVCQCFALVAAAGELATEFGITGWPQGEAERAAARCFSDWLLQRGCCRGFRDRGRYPPSPCLYRGARSPHNLKPFGNPPIRMNRTVGWMTASALRSASAFGN